MASKSSVATKTAPTKAKAALPKDAETPEKDGAETPEKDGPLPLLDLSDAAVKKMIKQAKKRGYVTARWSCSRARAKSPSPSASRPAARR
jgi:hypothetical protein